LIKGDIIFVGQPEPTPGAPSPAGKP